MRRFAVTLLLVGGFAATAVGVWLHRARVTASEELDRALARHAAQGLVVRWEDLAAGIPWPIAECALARYDLMKRSPTPPRPVSPDVTAGSLEPDLLEDPVWRASVDAHIATVDPWCREVAELERRCPGPLTSAGVNVPSVPGEDLLAYGLAWRRPDLLGLRCVANWAALRGLRATTAEERRAALDDLDREIAAVRPAMTLEDAVFGLAIYAIRDETYAALAFRGRLDPARLDSWLDEPSRRCADIADGWRGERLLHVLPLVRALTEGRPMPKELGDHSWSWDPASIWRDHVSWPWEVLKSGEEVLEAHAAMERRLRTGEGSEAAETASTRNWDPVWPLDQVVPCFLAPVASAADRDQRHRSLRIAALLAEEAHRGVPLPKSDGEARVRLGSRAAWLDGHPLGYRLLYERLTDEAFRVVVDPVAPLPAVLWGLGRDGRLSEFDLAPPLGSKTPEQLVADPRWSPWWGTRVVLRRP